MTGQPICRVKRAAEQLRGIIDSGRLVNPWSRQRALEIVKLLDDVAWGRGGADHIPTMEALALRLCSESTDEPGGRVGGLMVQELAEHRETFQSHIDTTQLRHRRMREDGAGALPDRLPGRHRRARVHHPESARAATPKPSS